jgi:hypothetical protein
MLIMSWVLFTIVAASLIALAFGAWRWRRMTDTLWATLEAASLVPSGDAAYGVPKPDRYVSHQELGHLPAPVQRYFRAVLQEGQPMVASVAVEHAGRFNLSGHSERWRPFVSTQRVTVKRTGFVWNGRIDLLPGVRILVHDAYIGGRGILHANLCGLITLAELQGTSELTRGELMRFLAEAIWYPTALLPSQGVDWEPVDETSARATLADGDVTASLLMCFDEKGLIASARADDRGRTVGARVVPTPWEVRCWHYDLRDGMRVPLEGEAAWCLEQGRQPYWHGRIANLTYTYSG